MKKLIIISLAFILGCSKEEVSAPEDYGTISFDNPNSDYVAKRPYTVSEDSGYTRVEYDAFNGQYKIELAIIYNTKYPNKTKIMYQSDASRTVVSTCGKLKNKDTCMSGIFNIYKLKDKTYINGSTNLIYEYLYPEPFKVVVLKNLVLKKD